MKNQTTQSRAIHRIKIIQGHLKKIEKMILEGSYCLDVVHQSRAVQSALKQLDLLIIKSHLSSCVVSQIKNNEENKSIAELLKLFEYK